MTDGNLFEHNKEMADQEQEIYKLRERVRELELRNVEADFLKPDKTFGVAVCGDVMLNQMEVEIVNTPAFQRLRKIKQLGTTYLVYVSAIHTRFEHSLGVLKKADLIISKIRKNQHSAESERRISTTEEQIVRLMALLHDIGHMPFGHTIEDEFGIFKSHDKHLTRWEYFVGEFSEIGKIIIAKHGKVFFDRFFKLITCEKDFVGLENDAFMYDIVSNTVCADLLDYLDRDCTYTNLKLSYHPRFLDYFFIKDIKNSASGKIERRIAIRVYKKGKKEIRHDTISELIQLLRNRYYLGERVYYHHTKILTGTILAGAVLRAKEAGCFSEIPLHASLGLDESDALGFNTNVLNNKDSKTDKALYSIHQMGDEELIQYLKNLPLRGKSEQNQKMIRAAQSLARRLDLRFLYTEILYKTKEDINISDEHDVAPISKGDCDKAKSKIARGIFNKLIVDGSCGQRLQIEEDVCSYLSDMESGDVLIYCPNFNMAMKLAKMKVVNQHDQPFELKDFHDSTVKTECNSIIKSHQNLWALRVFVNPKFIDKGQKGFNSKYSKYKTLIEKYIQWKLFDETEKGDAFWDEFLPDRARQIAGEKTVTFNDMVSKVEELKKEFTVNTKGTRKIGDIDRSIREKFSL